MTWEFNAGYDSDAAKKNFRVKKISDKRRTTFSKTSNMKHTDKYIALYNKKGNKTNEWRIDIFHAVRVGVRKVAEIARLVHKEKGASGWDGIGHTDKQFKPLIRRVVEALKRVEAE